MSAVTLDTTGWTMREVAHYNGGAAWFGYLYQCVQEPRLVLFKRYDKKTRTATATWRVDGNDQVNLDAAKAALLEVLP